MCVRNSQRDGSIMQTSSAKSAPGEPNVDRTSLSAASSRLSDARAILLGEATAIVGLANALDESFLKAVEALRQCTGQIVVSGMGKAGLIGRKVSATLASTGSRSIFLHPAEAVHGDLGRIDCADILLLLSYSGETEELNRLLPTLKSKAQQLIAITGSASSTLGRNADLVLPLGALREVCPLGLAPSTSTTAMLALGDALALMVSRENGFTREQFALNHPAGSLGRSLALVEQVMRPLHSCRIALAQTSLCDVLVHVSQPGRRSGAVMLVDDLQRLVGIFTDSDLARLLEQRRHSQLDAPIAEVMTTKFRTVQCGQPLSDAVELLTQYKISELPVLDQHGCPLGLIDITDVVGLVTPGDQLQSQEIEQDCNIPSTTSSVHGPLEQFRMSADGELISVSITSGRRGEK